MTYSERCSNLSNVLVRGDGIPCKISKPRRRYKKGIQNEKMLMNNKRVRNSLQLWRKENGLTCNHGFVKNSTKVLFDDTRYLQSFDSHPFFHKIPYACIQETLLGNQAFAELQCLEKETLELLRASTKKKYTSHKYGANEGISCGILFPGSVIQALKPNLKGSPGHCTWINVPLVQGMPTMYQMGFRRHIN